MKAKKVAVAVLAAVMAYGAFQVAHRQAPTQEVESAPLYPQLLEQMNDARKLTIALPGERISIVRTGEGWGLGDRDNFPVAGGLVKELLMQVAGFRIREAKTSKPELYASLGVEDLSADKAASRQITVLDAKEQPLVDLVVGKERKAKGADSPGYFVRRAGEAGAWLVTGDLTLKTKRNDWLDTNIVNVPVERVRQSSLLADGHPPVVVAKASPKEQLFTLQNIPTGQEPKSVALVSNVGGVLLDLRFDDVAAASRVAGLTPQRTAVVETFDGLVATLKLYEVEGKRWASLGFEHRANAEAAAQPTAEATKTPGVDGNQASGKETKAPDVATEVRQLNEKTAAWVYQLPDYKLRTLDKQLSDLTKPKDTRPPPPAQ